MATRANVRQPELPAREVGRNASGEGTAQSNGQLVGKGAEHQTKNYPFIKSYENLDVCTSEVKQKTDSCQQDAKQFLKQLRA